MSFCTYGIGLFFLLLLWLQKHHRNQTGKQCICAFEMKINKTKSLAFKYNIQIKSNQTTRKLIRMWCIFNVNVDGVRRKKKSTQRTNLKGKFHLFFEIFFLLRNNSIYFLYVYKSSPDVLFLFICFKFKFFLHASHTDRGDRHIYIYRQYSFFFSLVLRK